MLGTTISLAIALSACGLLELIPTPISQQPGTPTAKQASLRPVTRLPEQELPAPPTVATSRGEVSATDGGSVTSPAGDLSLVVPPGALKQDTDIEITYYAYAPHSGNPMAGEAVFGPSGLKFQQPAILSIALPEPGYSLNCASRTRGQRGRPRGFLPERPEPGYQPGQRD